AVIPPGNPLAVRLIAELNPFSPAVVMVSEAVLPGVMLALVALDRREMPGAGFTVSAKGTALESPPPVAAMERVALPAVAPDATVRVSVLFPLPGAARLAGANFAVTPEGKPLTDKATAELNPFCPATASEMVTLPEIRLALVGFAVRFKTGLATV